MPTVRWKDDPLEYQRQRYRENPEYYRAWHQKHKAKRLVQNEACRKARKAKDPVAFLANSAERQRLWRERNPGKMAVYQKAYYKRHPGIMRKINMKRLFNLTVSQADNLLLSGCGICGRVATCIDHVHGTKIIRGGLCSTCNGGLGMFYDDPVRLRKAIVYLERKRP